MAALVSFFVACEPPKTTAQQKGVAFTGGRPRFYKKAKVAATETLYSLLLRKHAPKAPLGGPLQVWVEITFPWRKGDSQAVRRLWKRIPHPVRPDADNLEKTLLDVMSKLGFWSDDAQVADLRLRKFFGDVPGIGIAIGEAVGEPRGVSRP